MSNEGGKGVPAVTIVMPAFRAGRTLPEAVASIRAQAFTDWELVIVEDGSGDDTAAVAARLARDDPRIRLIVLPENRGPAQARNQAIAVARGRFIAFLDADDLWLPGKLSAQIAFMQETGVALSYAGYWREGPRGSRRAVRVPPAVTHAELLHGNVIGCLTAIYDSAQIGRMQMPDIRMNQDYALWLAILRRVPEARGLAEPLAVYRRHAGSLSWRIWPRLAGTWAMFRQVEGLGRFRTLRCMAAHYRNRWRAMR